MNQLIERYNHFLATQKYNPAQLHQLSREQDYVIQNALDNIGLNIESQYNDFQLDQFEVELKRSIESVFTDFPCLIDENHHANLQVIKPSEPPYTILAQNLFKVLTHGTATNLPEKTDLYDSALYHEVVIKHFTSKRDPHFSRSICHELQQLFNRAFDLLKQGQLDEKKYEIFQNQLLSSYPFWDPDTQRTVNIPQKIGGEWHCVEYLWNKFDISPRTGLLAKLIEDRDRIYAYALEPVLKQPSAKSHLLLMGTTYPSGQGSKLADLENFRPLNSVGEGHDLELVYQWLKQQDEKSVNVTGHSKGATMAMIVAAQYPKKVNYASCLNPAGLSSSTLNHLNPNWLNIPAEQRPTIEVFAQKGDPVFPLEKGFLQGTKITKVIASDDATPALNFTKFGLSVPFRNNYQAHIFIGAGHPQGIFLNSNVDKENNSHLRLYFNDVKFVFNFFRYAQTYAGFVVFLLYRKLHEHIGSMYALLKDKTIEFFDELCKNIHRANSPFFTFLVNFVVLFLKIPGLIIDKTLTFAANLIDFVLTSLAKLVNLVGHMVSIVSGLSLGSLKYVGSEISQFLGEPEESKYSPNI